MREIISSLDAFEILKPLFNPYAEEVWTIALNSNLRYLGTAMIFRGTVDHCPVHPRDIFRYLISLNAKSFILAHNHPSLDVYPSFQDLKVTRDIQKLAVMIQIPLQDHLIFTSDKYFSMADNGQFKKRKK